MEKVYIISLSVSASNSKNILEAMFPRRPLTNSLSQWSSYGRLSRDVGCTCIAPHLLILFPQQTSMITSHPARFSVPTTLTKIQFSLTIDATGKHPCQIGATYMRLHTLCQGSQWRATSSMAIKHDCLK